MVGTSKTEGGKQKKPIALQLQSKLPRAKEISEEMKTRVLTAHPSEQCSETILKRFQLQPVGRQIISKLIVFNMTASLPRSRRPSKLLA